MDWISLPISSLAIALIAVAVVGQLRFERRLDGFANVLREDKARMVELRYLEALGVELEAAPAVTETIVDSGATMVQEIHRGLTRIPFGIMKSIPLMKQPSEMAQQTHDLVADVVYDSIRDVNKVAGKAGRDALQMRRKQWEKLIDKQSES